MTTTEGATTRSRKGTRIAIAGLSALALWGVIATALYQKEKQQAVAGIATSKLMAERELGERLQLEKKLAGMDGRYNDQVDANAAAEARIAELQKRMDASLSHAKGLEGAARRSKTLAKEVELLRTERQEHESRLAVANKSARDLEERLARSEKERERLASELADHRSGAQMVNNAEVDALRGKNGRITVVARRAREIRMAFDLPEALAKGASFRIITPSGRKFDGADPSLSWTLDDVEADALASMGTITLTPMKDRAQRVHLKFVPNKKLEPGAYRIDVMTDGAYLNTILLNLR